MNAFSTPFNAELSAELDALLAAPSNIRPRTGNSLSLAQKIKLDALSLEAMECDGDTVATINRLLDVAIGGLDDSPANDARRTAINAVRHFHLPSLLDAYEVDTRRAY